MRMKSVLLALLLIGAVGALAWPKLSPLLKPHTTTATATPTKTDTVSTALKVSAVRIDPVAFTETLSATGTLIPEEGVELQAETSGRVIAINFREGARVAKGSLLVKLNDAELRATLARSQHQLALAETRERRLAPLIRQGLVRQEDYDIVASEVDVQKAEIELTRAQIDKTEIRAPFDGVIGLRYVSEGAFVGASTRVATLQRLDKLKIDFSVPEKYAGRIRIGSPVQFSVAGSERRFDASIYAYDPRIDSGTRSILIRAQTDNPEHRLLPGAYANVELVLDTLSGALLVPAVAVVPGLNEKNVFVYRDGHAERRKVETGTRTATTVQILSGLAAGDVVITSGLQNLRAGQAVAIDAVALSGAPASNAAAGAVAPAAKLRSAP